MSNKQTDKMKTYSISDYTMQDATERVAEAKKQLNRADEILQSLLDNFQTLKHSQCWAMLNEAQACKGLAAHALLNFVEVRIIGEAEK